MPISKGFKDSSATKMASLQTSSCWILIIVCLSKWMRYSCLSIDLDIRCSGLYLLMVFPRTAFSEHKAIFLLMEFLHAAFSDHKEIFILMEFLSPGSLDHRAKQYFSWSVTVFHHRSLQLSWWSCTSLLREHCLSLSYSCV